MSSINELLIKLITLRGPCPDICDGTIPLGGPTGTDIVDIETGNPTTPYPIIEPTQVPIIPTLPLILTFNDINNANVLVGDATILSDWNSFFDLPTYGNAFTGVQVIGNVVQLFGGSNIKIKPALLYNNQDGYLISIVDNANCITSVGGDAFAYNYGLTTVDLPACTIIYGWQDSPQGDYGGFGECIALTTMNLSNLTTAGDYCFISCAALETINLPNLTTAGNNCFALCASLTEINLPKLTTAGNNCFYNCTVLETINLPDLTTAGNSCFENCPSLTTVNLPDLTTAGNSCFDSCSSLLTISLPSLTTAGSNFLSACGSLTTVDLPSLVSIGNNSLICISITTINMPSCTNLGPTTGDDNVFNGIAGNTITATFNSVLETCNSGDPDGDIQYLDANNDVTITYV